MIWVENVGIDVFSVVHLPGFKQRKFNGTVKSLPFLVLSNNF